MNVTQVSICPTEAATAAGAPALTPELLAASGARYSRNNEGLASILAKIDPLALDRSVDGIFRMLDYGHQSIADMVPVAMFMDGLSMWLAYYIWTLCPLAGGQESSTRYLAMGMDRLVSAEALGIPAGQQASWTARMAACLGAYDRALAGWEQVGERLPERLRIPRALLDDPDEASQRKVARMRRNYAFDRARYYLPMAMSTNMMLVMSARGWAVLGRHLSSHALPEARTLGEAIRGQLALCAPRLMKHAGPAVSTERGLAAVFGQWRDLAAAQGLPPELHQGSGRTDRDPRAHLTVTPPEDLSAGAFVRDLAFHENRYAWVGDSLKRAAVRFAWDAVTLAEIRDLNRHRTGNKFCPLIPLGFYAAADEWPDSPETADVVAELRPLHDVGRRATAEAHARLAAGDPAYVYSLPLGAQCHFEHLTTADKFIYEAELRTGVGSHYRYARHLHDALALWYAAYPETRHLILEGTAEPE